MSQVENDDRNALILSNTKGLQVLASLLFYPIVEAPNREPAEVVPVLGNVHHTAFSCKDYSPLQSGPGALYFSCTILPP